MGQQVVRPDDHLDLAHVAAGHLDAVDVRNGLEARGQLVEGVFAELGRVVAAGQDDRT